LLSFRLFEVLLPGLLLCASVVAAEPLYEALGEIVALRRMIFQVFAVNLALNIYLVPSAGLYGAAVATSIAMVLYCLLFGYGLDSRFRLDKTEYFVAGAAVYVTYMVMRKLQAGIAASVWLLPAILLVLFHAVDFFADAQTSATQLSAEGAQDGRAIQPNDRSS
jgi:O-antigen/teichoic acid export membrane protein